MCLSYAEHENIILIHIKPTTRKFDGNAMKKFMKTCYKCGTDVTVARCIKEGVTLNCLKCQNCGEEYFTSSELMKFDIQTGRRKMVRKFGIVGDSTVMRFPSDIIKDYKIKPGD